VVRFRPDTVGTAIGGGSRQSLPRGLSRLGVPCIASKQQHSFSRTLCSTIIGRACQDPRDGTRLIVLGVGVRCTRGGVESRLA